MKPKYPKPVKHECGCKVSWNWYTSKKKAEKCAKLAREEGDHWAARGYDFGFTYPGTIYHNKDGLYQVVLP